MCLLLRSLPRTAVLFGSIFAKLRQTFAFSSISNIDEEEILVYPPLDIRVASMM